METVLMTIVLIYSYNNIPVVIQEQHSSMHICEEAVRVHERAAKTSRKFTVLTKTCIKQ